jgi:hypothetical protein
MLFFVGLLSAAGSAWAATINGTSRNETLRGSPAADRLYGKAGHDKLFRAGGDDSVVSRPGNDVLVGGRCPQVGTRQRGTFRISWPRTVRWFAARSQSCLIRGPRPHRRNRHNHRP